MSHKLLNAVFSSAQSEDGHSVTLESWGGTLPDALPALESDKNMDKRHVFVQPPMHIPENKMMTYKKYMIECAINLLKDMCESLPPDLYYNKSGEQEPKGLTEHAIHEDQLVQLKVMSSALVYMVNSDSWNKGTSESYDIKEVQRKLGMLISN